MSESEGSDYDAASSSRATGAIKVDSTATSVKDEPMDEDEDDAEGDDGEYKEDVKDEESVDDDSDGVVAPGHAGRSAASTSRSSKKPRGKALPEDFDPELFLLRRSVCCRRPRLSVSRC